jgi:hypothetical protein
MIRPVLGLLLALGLVFLIVDLGPRWQVASAAWAASGTSASSTVDTCAAHDDGVPPVPASQPSPRTDGGDEAIVADYAAMALTHALHSTPPVQLQSEAPAAVWCLIPEGTTVPRRTEIRVYTSRAPPGSPSTADQPT